MNQVPQADITEIKGRLVNLERQVADLDDSLDDRIELAMRRLFEKSSKQSRDMTSWIIGIVAFVLVIVFSVTQVAVGLWG